MPIPQTSVSSMAAGYPGMESDASRDQNNRSYVSEEASAEIPFGVFVGQGAADDGMLLLAATSDKVIGVLLATGALPKDLALGDTGLKPKMTGTVKSRGRCFVYVEEAVTPASSPLIRCIATGGEKAGSLRDTADASDCLAAPWIRILGTTTGAGFVEVEYDVMNRGLDAID